MTENQKKLDELLNVQSKEKQRALELATRATLNDEARKELDAIETRAQDHERKLRVLRAAVNGETKEVESNGSGTDALTELRSKCRVGNWLLASVTGKQLDGAEAEYAAEVKSTAIPLSVFETARPAFEQRAVTPATSTVGVNLQPIQPQVFAGSLAGRLGIEMPAVESGTYASATITAKSTASMKAKGADTTANAVSFGVQSTTPKRLSTALSLRVEDLASVGQENFESALRQNLMNSLSDELDNQVINGTGTGDQAEGLLAQLTNPVDPAAVSTFNDYATAFAGQIDGLFARTLGEVAMVVNPATYAHASSTFQAATNYQGEMSAASYAMNMSGGFFAHARMPDTVSTIATALVHRMGSMLPGAVCPHWSELTIDDIYSDAGKGIRTVYMHALIGDVILMQSGAYRKVEFKLPA